MSEISEEKLKAFADDLLIGFKCYVHRETGEVISFPDPEQMIAATGEFGFEEELQKVEDNEKEYIELTPMRSSQMYRVMSGFTETITDARTRQRLEHALEGPKPMRNFNYQVHESGQWRDEWFKYRDQQQLQHVKEQIELALEEEDDDDDR